jgi:hypothetical protein
LMCLGRNLPNNIEATPLYSVLSDIPLMVSQTEDLLSARSRSQC